MKIIVEKMLQSRHERRNRILREHDPLEVSIVQSSESLRNLSFRF